MYAVTEVMFLNTILDKKMKIKHLAFLVTISVFYMTGCEIRIPTEIDLSKNNWSIWLDKYAEWVDDELFLPPVDIKTLPVNPPTIGWEKLFQVNDIEVNLPATIEEHFWQESGNERGISGNYTGVSWLCTGKFSDG